MINPIGFTGRISRLDYFISLLIWISYIAIWFILGIFLKSAIGNFPAAGLLFVFNFPLYFSAVVRRLHDINKTGWLSLLSLIPVVGIILTIYLLFPKGDYTSNKYGEIPC